MLRRFPIVGKSPYKLRRIRPSVRMYQRGSRWKDFLEI